MIGVNDDGSTGWHIDSGSEGATSYLYNNNYRFAKVALMLHKNTDEWGGGISIVPRGHCFPFRSGNKWIDFKIKHLKNKLYCNYFYKTIYSEPGDLVFFDSRLPHASTIGYKLVSLEQKNGLLIGLPDEATKYVIFWNACAKEMAYDFLQHSVKRSQEESLSTGYFFTDYLSRVFPDDYPDEFNDSVHKNQIYIPSLSNEEANIFKSRMSNFKK